MTDIGLAAIARGCPRLRHLGVGGCIRLTDGSVRVVAIRAGGALRALDISGCQLVGKGFFGEAIIQDKKIEQRRTANKDRVLTKFCILS